MTNYLLNYKKRIWIFEKREQELVHALNHSAPFTKLIFRANRVRESRFAALKSDHERYFYRQISAKDAQLKSIEKKLAKIESLRAEWEAKSTDEIIEEYRTKYIA